MHLTPTYVLVIAEWIVSAVLVLLCLAQKREGTTIAGTIAALGALLIFALMNATLMDNESNVIVMVAGVLLIIELALLPGLVLLVLRLWRLIKRRATTP